MGSFLFQKNGPDKINDIPEENNFPKEINYEKELMSNFKYFNVFWYDPNNNNDYDIFKNSFQNVRFVKGNNLESAINFFQKESSSDEWIIVTPGSKGEELIKQLEQNKCINAFFVYCWNTELHKNWTKNIKKVKCLTSDPDILKQKFIELNKNYIFPIFRYDNMDININKSKDAFDFLLNLKDIDSENEYALNSVKREIKILANNINKSKNKYNNFCMKAIHYLETKNCINDYRQPVPDENSILYHYVKFFKSLKDEQIGNLLKFMKNNILLSLYFNQYKYILNLFCYEEVKTLFKPETSSQELGKREQKAISIIDTLIKKIMDKQSIIKEKNNLKEIQKYYITFIFNNFILANKKLAINFYQIINFLRDFDFCLKIYIYYNFIKLNNKNYNFFENIFPVIFSDERVSNFFVYLDDGENTPIEISEENKKKIEKSLAIKDFLIIGNKKFQDKIKSIETKLKAKSLKYLKVEEISNYIKTKNEEDKLRAYFYYIIINFEEMKNNFEKLILISAKFGITFIIILYIENYDIDNSFIEKKYISNSTMISIILVYTIEDILNYFSYIKGFNFSMDLKEFLNSFDAIKLNEKKGLYKNNEEDCQDGCFELTETFDINIVKNKTILSYDDEIDYSSISDDIYMIYKEHNALDLFFRQNMKYFGFNLEPEINSFDICFIKRILYMYCREEIESEKSFYRMINDDLRTKDPKKIDRFIILLGLFYKSIENKELSSFKGKVYRATKLDENLILKLKPGSTMINTTFWSTTKNFAVAENFMEIDSWRNAYILCENTKTNIDIDSENLNPFNEEEVLILPFTEYKVQKIHSENKYNKKIYIIELIELGNKNLVNYDNMNVETINDVIFSKAVEKFFFQKKI